MGNTLAGNTVLLFGGQKDIAPHPVVMLGVDANGQPQPILVGTNGVGSVNLAQVGGTTFALGQALAAASLPVVLTAAQLATLAAAAQLPAALGAGGGLKIDGSGTIFPVTATPTQAALTNRSGTITSGGTAQEVAASLSTRRYFLFQNISDETMWINFGTAAVADQPSIQIVAGASYENPPHFCPTGAVSVISATTGKKFVAKEA